MSGQSREQRPREPELGEDQTRQETEHPVDARLRVYLRRLVDAQGRMKAADALNVNYKTLARGLDEPGPLTVWLRAALLVKALEDRLTALAPEEQEQGDAGAGVPSGHEGELSGDVRDATEALRSLTTAVEQLRHEDGERLTALEARLAAVEAQPQPEAQLQPGEPGEPGEPEAAPVIGAPRIDRRDIREPSAAAGPRPAPAHVVTEEAGPGDEDIYGAAWPLVEEWRAVHAGHSPQGRGVDWLRDEERLRELEIALIAEHELALPPERYRWDGFTRRAQLRWRERTLARVRGERRRAQWRRRLLTLGLRWK